MASKRAPAGQDAEPAAKKQARRPEAKKPSAEVEKTTAPIKVSSTRADGGPAKELALRPKAGRLGAVGTTHQIQTTQQPWKTITVSEIEYQQLLAQGLVYSGSPVTPAADFYDNILADKVANGSAFPAALGTEAADSGSPFGSALRAALVTKPAQWKTDLVHGAYVSHRGDYQINPEDTMEAFRAAVASGAKALKLDAIKLADGSYGVMHDPTFNRTTGGARTDAAANMWPMAWKNVTLPGSLYGPGVPDCKPPLLTEVFNEFGGRVVLMIEPKDGYTALAGILAEIARRGIGSSCCITMDVQDTSNWPPDCAAVGVGSLAYWNAGGALTPDPATVLAKNPSYLGIGYQYSDANITTVVNAAHAAGKLVHGFSLNRRFERDRMLGLGIDIIQSNDSVYLKASAPLSTSARLSVGAPFFGLANAGSPGAGTVHLPLWIGSAGSARLSFPASGQQGFVLGGLSPLPATFTITGRCTWDAVDSDASRFAFIALLADDGPFNADARGDGWSWVIRQNGGVQCFLQTPGATTDGVRASGTSTSTGPAVGTTAITAGQVIPWSLQRTSTNLILKRTDTNDAITVAHGGKSVPYLHIGAARTSGLAVSFDQISVGA